MSEKVAVAEGSAVGELTLLLLSLGAYRSNSQSTDSLG